MGAHSGTFNLLSFDGTTLRSEAGGFSSSPGVGEIADINGDGVGEVILDASDYYVFCYACGVRLAQYDVLRWNGTRFEPVTLQPLPSGAPEVLRAANDRAVELANAGLWQDTQALMLETLDTGETDATYDWNLRLIQLNTGAKRAAAVDTEGGYDILDNIFYGDLRGRTRCHASLYPRPDLHCRLAAHHRHPGRRVHRNSVRLDRPGHRQCIGSRTGPGPGALSARLGRVSDKRRRGGRAPHVARAASIAHADLFYREAVGFLAGNPVPTRAPAAATSAPIATPSAATSTPRPAATTAAQPTSAVQADAAPVSAPADRGAGRLFFSTQDADGRDTIYLLEDGDAVPQVVDAVQPALQPDGTRLAFHSTRADMLGLGGVELTTGERLRFTFSIEDSAPTWDPATQQIIFASTRYGDGKSRLYQVWADGRGEAADLGFGQDPNWHPREARIAFRGCDEAGGRCGLWTMTPDGAEPTSAHRQPRRQRPVWSPDGRYVVFMSNERDGNWESLSGRYGERRDPAADRRPGQRRSARSQPRRPRRRVHEQSGRRVEHPEHLLGRWSGACGSYAIGDNVADWLDQGIAWER